MSTMSGHYVFKDNQPGLNPRAMGPVPFQVRLLVEFRAVLRGIDGDEHLGGELFAAHAT